MRHCVLGFEVLTAVVMKCSVSGDIIFKVNGCFRGICASIFRVEN
jgi:hypothetical protein